MIIIVSMIVAHSGSQTLDGSDNSISFALVRPSEASSLSTNDLPRVMVPCTKRRQDLSKETTTGFYDIIFLNGIFLTVLL